MSAGVVLAVCSLFVQVPQAWAQLELSSSDVMTVGALDLHASAPPPSLVRPAPSPSRSLVGLQSAFIGLQALDVVSTMRALDHGHQEVNPLMRDVARHPAALVAAKAGSAAATLWLVRRLGARNRVAALVTMAALDASYAVIVASNFSTAARR